MSTTQSSIRGRAAVRLLQGYLWHPTKAELDLESFLPRELELSSEINLSEENAHVLWDEVNPPFAFFDNGEPTASQTFFQFTVLRVYDQRPSNELLHNEAQSASYLLNPLLDGTPEGVGWQIWEDLREL